MRQHYHGGQPKRLRVNHAVYCPSTTSMEAFNNDGLFAEHFLGSDASALLAVSPSEDQGLNRCLPQNQTPQGQSQPSNALQMNQANLGPIANNVVNQFRFEQLENSKACQSPLTDLDQSDPWTPLDMNGNNSFRPAAKPLQTPWNQQEHRSASFHNPLVSFQFGKDGNVTSRPRSDSGYGTFPNPNKSPPTESTTQTQFSGEQMSLIPDCLSLANNMEETAFHSTLNLDFDQFTDNDHHEPFKYLKTTSVDSENIPNQPPENGPFICQICLREGCPLEIASLKNKSEWK